MMRVKEEVNEKEKELLPAEEPVDIEAVMQKKKKKITLKLKNYKYSSIDDIFERRNQLPEQAATNLASQEAPVVSATHGGDEATMVEAARNTN